MRKPSRKTLKNKLDKKVSELVRARGQCERCGKKTNLQACHIFSRKYLNTRWGLDNLLCLCAGCHFWSHANPILFAEWIQKFFPIEYNVIKESHNLIYKPTIEDLTLKLKVLSELK